MPFHYEALVAQAAEVFEQLIPQVFVFVSVGIKDLDNFRWLT